MREHLLRFITGFAAVCLPTALLFAVLGLLPPEAILAIVLAAFAITVFYFVGAGIRGPR